MSRRILSVASATVALAAIAAAVVLGARPPGRAATGATTVPPAVRTPIVERSRLVTVEVGGMVCAGCVAKIDHQLAQVAGVRRVDVSLRDQRAQVLCEPSVADTALTAAVRRAGPEYIGFIVTR